MNSSLCCGNGWVGERGFLGNTTICSDNVIGMDTVTLVSDWRNWVFLVALVWFPHMAYEALKQKTVRVIVTVHWDPVCEAVILRICLRGVIFSARLRSITLDRSLAEKCGATCPSGFREWNEEMISEDDFAIDYAADHQGADLSDPSVRSRIHREYLSEIRELRKHNVSHLTWRGDESLFRWTPIHIVIPIKTEIPDPISFSINVEYRVREVLGGYDVLIGEGVSFHGTDKQPNSLK